MAPSIAQVATKRLLKEAAEMKASPISGIRLMYDDQNLFKWMGELDGPEGTSYEGGEFKFELFVPEDYPLKPPHVKCVTKTLHVNINHFGNICLDLLKDKWSPMMSLQNVMDAIRDLMQHPNPYDPLVPELASLFMNNPDEYYRRVKLFTRKFAK